MPLYTPLKNIFKFYPYDSSELVGLLFNQNMTPVQATAIAKSVHSILTTNLNYTDYYKSGELLTNCGICTLPLRFGGMGIQNPVDTADSEFMASSAITRNLTDLIMQQTTDVDRLDRAEMAKVKASLFTPCADGRILVAFLYVASRHNYLRHFIAASQTQF